MRKTKGIDSLVCDKEKEKEKRKESDVVKETMTKCAVEKEKIGTTGRRRRRSEGFDC
jgi:hypothetical protein